MRQCAKAAVIKKYYFSFNYLKGRAELDMAASIRRSILV
jgi:hypothetical protein